MKGSPMAVITISHQHGSLGIETARLAADCLGFDVVGQDKIHEMAMACDIRYQDACQLYDRQEFAGFFERLMMDKSAFRALFESLHFDLAGQGDIIIMGRGSQFVFQGLDRVLNARIIAEKAARVVRMAERLECSLSRAEDYLDKAARKQETVLKSVFGQDPDDPGLFDLVINTTGYSASQAGELICKAAALKGESRESGNDPSLFLNLAKAKRIETLLRREIYVLPHSRFDVRIEEGGKVVLDGMIGKSEDVSKADEIVAADPDVSVVDNRLRVVGPGDLTV